MLIWSKKEAEKCVLFSLFSQQQHKQHKQNMKQWNVYGDICSQRLLSHLSTPFSYIVSVGEDRLFMATVNYMFGHFNKTNQRIQLENYDVNQKSKV